MSVQTRGRSHPAGGRRAAARALATDVGLIVLFAAAGRRAHADTGAVEEALTVAAPFAAGRLLAALAVVRVGRARARRRGP